VTLVALNSLVAWFTYRSKGFESLVEGRPQILIHNGRLHDRVLSDARLTRHELHAALRQAGCATVDEVQFAVLENNGSISVISRRDSAPKDA
jgi:uncharacterized membrane protein YcaP (DUF421 family)